MKIAFFTDFTNPPQNGVWTSILNLSSALCKLGHEVIIFTPKPASKRNYTSYIEPRMQIKYLPSMPAMVYPNLRLGVPVSPAAIKKIRDLQIDLIHVHSPLTVGIGGVIIGKLLRLPVIGTQHNYAMEEDFLEVVNIRYMTRQISSFLWHYTEALLNQCDDVIAPMELIRDDLLTHGIKPAIHVLPNTIQPQAIKRVATKELDLLRERLKLKSNVVLFVGRLSKEKCIDTLLESFALVTKKHTDVSLLVIGDGPESKSLLKLKKKLHLSDNVVFTGEIDQETLLTKGYYQLADVVASASMTEVQPVSIIEAFYFGIPVVAVEKLGTLEMVKDVGILAKPDNPKDLAQKISSVLENKSLRETLQKASRNEYLTKYESVAVAKEYMSICKTLVARKRSLSAE